MFTSPLWLREHEEIPEFKLLPIQGGNHHDGNGEIPQIVNSKDDKMLPQFKNMNISD